MGAKLHVELQGLFRINAMLGKINLVRNPRIMNRGLTRIILEIQREVTTSGDFIKHGRGDAPPLPDVLTSRKGGAGLVGSLTPDYSGLPRLASLGSDLPYAGRHEDSRRAYLFPTYLKMEGADRLAEIMVGVVNEELASA